MSLAFVMSTKRSIQFFIQLHCLSQSTWRIFIIMNYELVDFHYEREMTTKAEQSLKTYQRSVYS
jgi:hypothetical protein